MVVGQSPTYYRGHGPLLQMNAQMAGCIEGARINHHARFQKNVIQLVFQDQTNNSASVRLLPCASLPETIGVA
jgi:hypothetical protein